MIRYKETATSAPNYPANISDGSLVDTLTKTITSYKHSGRTEKRYYWYSAWVLDSADLVSTVQQDSAFIPIPKPLASFSATYFKNDTILIVWDTTGKSTDSKRVMIRYATPTVSPTPTYFPPFPNGSTLLDTFAMNVTSFKHRSRAEKRYHWYSAWIFDSSGNYSLVCQDSAWVPDYIPPTAVTGFTASWLAADTVNLTWGGTMSSDAYRIIIRYNASASSVASYPSDTNSGTLLNRYAIGTTQVKHAGRQKSWYYWYKIWVVDSAGNIRTPAQDSAYVPNYLSKQLAGLGAENQSPTILSDGTATAFKDEPFIYPASAEGDSVFITFGGLPSWLSAEDSTVSGTCPVSATDTNFIVFASDGVFTDTQIVVISVLDGLPGSVPTLATNPWITREPNAYPVPAKRYQDVVIIDFEASGSLLAQFGVYDLLGTLVYRQEERFNVPDEQSRGLSMDPWDLTGLNRGKVAPGGYLGILRLKNLKTGEEATFRMPLAITE
jgi:hypothetical protein